MEQNSVEGGGADVSAQKNTNYANGRRKRRRRKSAIFRKEADMTLGDYYRAYLVSKAGGAFIPWPPKRS